MHGEENMAGIEKAMAQAPDEMSEIPRELMTLRGAISSLHGVTNDLLGKISPIQRDVPEDSPELKEVTGHSPVTTEISRALRELYEEVSTIENKIARAYHRSEL